MQNDAKATLTADDLMPPMPQSDPKNVLRGACRAKTSMTGDAVDHPAHYDLGGVEAIDVIAAAVPDFGSYCHGNALKYLLRAGRKGGYYEDVRKARKYLDFMLENNGG